jgi:hypothetical protein
LSERTIQYGLLPAVLLVVLVVKVWLAFQYRVPIWDAYVYLSNARGFLLGRGPYELYSSSVELLRPPLFPYIISLLWRVTGVNYYTADVVQPVFTVAAAYVFFLLLRRMFGPKPALVGSILLLASPVVFQWTDRILVHGVGLFFIVTSFYFLYRGINGEPRYLPFSGGALAFATLTRYPILVLVPVFAVILLWLLSVSIRKRKRYPWLEVGAMVLFFVLAWTPWLFWNYKFTGDPFASLWAGFASGAETGAPEPWYFYIVNMPVLLGVVGTILLLVGLLDRGLLKDKGKFVLVLWIVAFFLSFTLIVNKQTRFYIEWAPPLACFAALGFYKLESRMPSRTKILAWILIGLWLFATFYPAVNAGLSDSRVDEQAVGSYNELEAVSAWIKVNSAQTDIGATDFAPALSFETDHHFYDVGYIQSTASAEGLTADQFMSQLGVRIVVIRPIHDLSLVQKLKNDPNYTIAKEFPTWTIFWFNCSNCTKL